jgi:hypothetical protein
MQCASAQPHLEFLHGAQPNRAKLSHPGAMGLYTGSFYSRQNELTTRLPSTTLRLLWRRSYSSIESARAHSARFRDPKLAQRLFASLPEPRW